MKSLKGTKTAQNLMNAFAGESQAKNKYQFKKNKFIKVSTMNIIVREIDLISHTKIKR